MFAKYIVEIRRAIFILTVMLIFLFMIFNSSNNMITNSNTEDLSVHEKMY